MTGLLLHLCRIDPVDPARFDCDCLPVDNVNLANNTLDSVKSLRSPCHFDTNSIHKGMRTKFDRVRVSKSIACNADSLAYMARDDSPPTVPLPAAPANGHGPAGWLIVRDSLPATVAVPPAAIDHIALAPDGYDPSPKYVGTVLLDLTFELPGLFAEAWRRA